jgi:hypothetical protein
MRPALFLEVGEALAEVVLGVPRLGVLFALGFRCGADESLHAYLALHRDVNRFAEMTILRNNLCKEKVSSRRDSTFPLEQSKGHYEPLNHSVMS